MKSTLPIVFTTLFIIAGCSQGPPTGDVSGMVTLDGKPVKDGAISFTPTDGQTAGAGSRIVDGKYSAQHVPVNKFRVEITAPKYIPGADKGDPTTADVNVMPPSLIPARYNTQSKLTLQVNEGANQHDFPLESK
jgi:hypothetical protein